MLEQVLITLGVMVTIWLLLQAVFFTGLRRERAMSRRIERIKGHHGHEQPEQKAASRSEQSIENALKELEAIKSSARPNSLRAKLRHSGARVTLRQHYLRAAILTALVIGLLMLIGTRPAVIFVLAPLAFYAFTHLYLNFLIRRRIRKIAVDFPVALEVVYRGIRAGLPLIEAIRLSSEEIAEPLRGEFSHMLNDLSVGLTMEESVRRFASRVPTQEASFFATVISIQSKTGGNLSGAIGSLLTMLREREKLTARVHTMSAEARTSAWIIGALPVFVGAVIFATSRDYIGVLVDTTPGNLVLAGCALWMFFGVLVMREMTSIEL